MTENRPPTVNDTDASGNEVPPSTEGDAPPAGAPSATEGPPANASINVRSRDLHNAELAFKMKRTTNLMKAMDAFCKRMGREYVHLRFIFEGVRLHNGHIPAELEMEDCCVVDVHEEQIGGAAAGGA